MKRMQWVAYAVVCAFLAWIAFVAGISISSDESHNLTSPKIEHPFHAGCCWFGRQRPN
jgi:hypothetical protein